MDEKGKKNRKGVERKKRGGEKRRGGERKKRMGKGWKEKKRKEGGERKKRMDGKAYNSKTAKKYPNCRLTLKDVKIANLALNLFF